MNVLVVGAGMYVTGAGTTGPGTILPALAEHFREQPSTRVTIVARRKHVRAEIMAAAARVNELLGTALQVEYLASNGNLDETLKDVRADCAIVCVPDHCHFEVASRLITRGLHCLIVKPLTPTLAEARELLALQRLHGTHCAVEFHKRFDEQNLFVRKVLGEGLLGRPVYMVVAYSQRIGIPLVAFREWAEKTNIFQYLGVHYIDLIYFLTGYIPVRVSAVGTRGVLDRSGVSTWDSVHATVVWCDPGTSNELVTQLAIGWIDPDATTALSDQRFLLVGSEGRMDLDQKDRGLTLVTRQRGVETPNPYFSMALGDPGKEAFQGYGHRSVSRFLSDVENVQAQRVSAIALEEIRASIRQALVSTAVVEAANRSLERKGEWSIVDDTT